MNIIKRVLLFAVTNILILITLSTVISLLGIGRAMDAHGIDYQSLAVFSLVWGMGGAFISLLLSRFMAKLLMRVKVIDPSAPGQYVELYQMVQNIVRSAHLPSMPQVGVYESGELNAFATGPSQRMALVAVSTGLLSRMSKAELEGVLAHEIAHIKNGDMVTMTLLQGVINAVVIFIARIIAFFATQAIKSDNRYLMADLIRLALEITLSILGSLVVFAFSRHREFKADAGSAKLVGSNKMIAALEALKRFHEKIPVDESVPSLSTLKINGGSSWASLRASHPPLEERIKALQTGQYN